MSSLADLNLPLSMSDFDESPILFANHFLVQPELDEFVITLSQVTGPPLVGTPDEMRAQAREHGGVPVHTLARVAVTRRRLIELIELLQARLQEHDRLLADREPAGSPR
jgi:hypothetical protein